MKEQNKKPTRLLSGNRVTLPKQWISDNEIKENDFLFIESLNGTVKISKAVIKEAD